MNKIIASKFDSMYGRTYVTEYTVEHEKTLRDEFAMAALTGYVTRGQGDCKQISEAAYIIADEMLRAREN